jgi:uncharacterized membrane protein (TIGR02234 family)
MTPQRFRGLILMAFVLGASITLIAWSQVWFTFTISLPSTSDDTLSVSGQQVAPALSALSLSSLAVVAALSLAGKVARIILLGVAAIVGTAIVATSVIALSSPLASSSIVFVKLTGNTSLDAIAGLISSTQITLFGALALCGGLAILCAAIIALVRLRNWPQSRSRKFDANSPAHSSSTVPSSAYRNVDSWDLLSRGTDPTIE